MPQEAESIYLALERAGELVRTTSTDCDFDAWDGIVSIPDSVAKNPLYLETWLDRFAFSVRAYESLVGMGVPKSDAIGVIPRGIKVGITKKRGLYNAGPGEVSLRLCNTAEPEMRAITEKERKLILDSDIPSEVKALIAPKCGYVGYCLEKRRCGKINEFDPHYNKERHAADLAQSETRIRARLRS
jgi:thymidylate synthase ThyX